jgi:dolichol kinase
MEPLHQNLLGALAMVVYIKTVIGVCDIAVSQCWLSVKITRKIIHVAAGSWIIFWPLFSTEHWTWKLNILVPAIYSVQLFVKGAIIQDPNDIDVKTMTRTGNPTELIYGPLFFTIIMNIVGIWCFQKEEGIVIMACLGFGDGMAPLAGGFFPFGKYPTYPFGPKDQKTLSGSLGFFVSSIVGFYLLRSILMDGSWDFGMILRVASITSVAEGITGAYDNIFIALTAYAATQYL